MNRIAILTSSLLLLASCNQSTQNKVENIQANSSDSAAAPAGNSGIDREFLTGTWTLGPNCAGPEVIYRADGTYAAAGGQIRGRWTLPGGNVLRMTQDATADQPAPAPQTLRMERVNDDQVRSLEDGASSYRCRRAGG
jgi:hypothetical protein